MRLKALGKFKHLVMPVFRNDGEPCVRSVFWSEIDNRVTLCIFLAVIPDDRSARNHVVLVNDAVADAAVLSDIDVVQQDGIMHRGIAVHENRVEQDGACHRASRNDASVADDGVDRLPDTGKPVDVNFFIMNEFRGRKTEW